MIENYLHVVTGWKRDRQDPRSKTIPSRFYNFIMRFFPGLGELVLIEPAITAYSRLYYQYVHPDDLDVETGWAFSGAGRMSASNCALPWIVFVRDRPLFEKRYPLLRIEKTEYSTTLAFFLTGGLRIRQLAPTWLIRIIFTAENWLIRHLTSQIAVTMALTIRKDLRP